MYLVVRVVRGRVLSAYIVRRSSNQPLEIINGKFSIEVNLGNSVEYEVLGEGPKLRLPRTFLQESDKDYPLTDGLNVFRNGLGEPALFVDFEVLRAWLKVVGIPEEKIPERYGFSSFDWWFHGNVDRSDTRVHFSSGEGRRLNAIQIGKAAQKSNFLESLSRYLDCFLDEELFELLQGESTDENLKKLIELLKEKAGITYKGLPDEGLHWMMLVNGEEKEYRPWVSRHGLSSLYLFHLVCKKYGWRKVFHLLRGGEGNFSEGEERVLAFYQSLESVEEAGSYLLRTYSVLVLELPVMGVYFSFNGGYFTTQHDLRSMPAPIGPLFRWHEGLGTYLLAKVPFPLKFRRVASYPNHEGFKNKDGILNFLEGENLTPAFLEAESVLLPANLSGVRQTTKNVLGIIGNSVLGLNPIVESVVNSDTYGRGHGLKSGGVVLHYAGARTKYLLLVSRQIEEGGERISALIDLEVSGQKGSCSYSASLHDGPYEIRNGFVVVKKDS